MIKFCGQARPFVDNYPSCRPDPLRTSAQPGILDLGATCAGDKRRHEMKRTHEMEEAPPVSRRGFFRVECRRRPTLPHPGECSTIGAGGLSFRVRDGTGRYPSATTTDNTINLFPLLEHTTTPTQNLVSRDAGCVLRVTQWMRATKVLWASPRPISTGRLHPSQGFHPRPINPIVSRGPYPRKVVGDLILERASRLDAFSGYPFRT